MKQKVQDKLKFLALTLLLSSCGGGGGSNQSTTPPAPIPRPTLSFSAEPLSVVVGETTTLQWTSNNTTACSASGAWEGSKSTSGNETIQLNTSQNYDFRLECFQVGL